MYKYFCEVSICKSKKRPRWNLLDTDTFQVIPSKLTLPQLITSSVIRKCLKLSEKLKILIYSAWFRCWKKTYLRSKSVSLQKMGATCFSFCDFFCFFSFLFAIFSFLFTFESFVANLAACVSMEKLIGCSKRSKATFVFRNLSLRYSPSAHHHSNEQWNNT